MSKSTQKTGGSATPGFGLKNGVSAGVRAHKPASIGKSGNVAPNSAQRGKDGTRK